MWLRGCSGTVEWTNHAPLCHAMNHLHPAGKPGLAQTPYLCDSFLSLSVQKALWSHRCHLWQPHRWQCLEVARWPKLWVPWQSTTLAAGFWSDCNCVLLTQRKENPSESCQRVKEDVCVGWKVLQYIKTLLRVLVMCLGISSSSGHLSLLTITGPITAHNKKWHLMPLVNLSG